MNPRTRHRIQALFFMLSLAVSFGLIAHRGVLSFYNSMHVLPSLSCLFWLTLPPALWVTVFFLLLPLLAGRLYCSYLCPVGFFQDLAAMLYAKAGVRGRSVTGSHEVRIFVLALSGASMALWSSSYLYFDHFSNLGRMYGVLDALLSGGPFGSSFTLGSVFLGIVVILPAFFPRWLCGAICPSGTLFALLQRLSIFKIRIGEDCSDCRLCHEACPTLCIENGEIDGDRCIYCLDCLPACPQNSIAFSPGGRLTRLFGKHPIPNRAQTQGRRRFIKTAVSTVFGATYAAFIKTQLLSAAPRKPRTIVPPGGSAWDQFMERCVACHTCVSVCPTDVLSPADLENSPLGLAKVRMDYDRGYCSYECNACLSVCPSKALSYFPLPVKQRIKMGSSKLDKKLCIPYAKNKDCAACHEQCPTGAITMKKEKNVFGPVLNDDYCIGCGSCQYACPVLPQKAIVVEQRAVHTFAFNPKQHGPKARIGGRYLKEAEDEGFPF